MIRQEHCIPSLISSGDIPHDAEVVSTNNKLVVVSESEKLVSRIIKEANFSDRDDPHDIRYSHDASWLASEVAPVVRPLHQQAIKSQGYIISTFPLLQRSTSLSNSAADIGELIRDFGNALDTVNAGMHLRRLNIAEYVSERIFSMQGDRSFDQSRVEYVADEFSRLERDYPFSQLFEDDPALIHGDYKADNIVADDNNKLHLIDLDAVAIGPRLYDVASWSLRYELGDDAPLPEVVEAWRGHNDWDEDAYRALASWKAISSMSFTLRYESPEVSHENLDRIVHCAARIGGVISAPGSSFRML